MNLIFNPFLNRHIKVHLFFVYLLIKLVYKNSHLTISCNIFTALTVRFLTKRYIGEYDHQADKVHKHETMVMNF